MTDAKRIDLHVHSFLSDGALLPSELLRRVVVKGYRAIAITDHADASNMEELVTGHSRRRVDPRGPPEHCPSGRTG
jgi:predicted metal-dependent phosphoesterase TrpH